MAKARPKILTIRMKEQSEGFGVTVEHGNQTLERVIPSGEGMSRLSAIFSDDGKLSDVELITEKI